MSGLKAAEQFLKNKGIDTEKYVIHDINGGYLPQIPIASWLSEFAEQQANALPTGEWQSNIPDVNQKSEQLLAFAEYIKTKTLTSLIGEPQHYVDRFLKANNCG